MSDQSFTLGQSVSYVRQSRTETGKIVTGAGIVRAMLVDHMGRRVVQIFDSSQELKHQVFNCDILAVNPSETFTAKYEELIAFVAAKSAEGNKAAEELIKQFNREIETAYNALLGEPLDLTVFQPASQAAKEAA